MKQKKKKLKEESDDEEKKQVEPIKPSSFDDGNLDVDGVDTDDLLEEIEQLIKPRKTKKKTKRIIKKASVEKQGTLKKISDVYDPVAIKNLSLKYPDAYWRFHADSGYSMINQINSDHPLQTLPLDISDQGAITGMTLSNDGNLLATFSNVGVIKVWDIQDDFHLLRKIRDSKETHIDEFYCGRILECGLLVTGGKLKDRYRWSAEDNDNHILPCPIKIFDLVTCERVAQLEGHSEEILCIKAIQFKGKNYFISTSQDGYIIKWEMDETWTKLQESTPMTDGITCMAFTVSFVPNTGNKYFIAACDEHLRLYDFEQSSFINWIDQSTTLEEMEKQVNQLSVDDQTTDAMDVDQPKETGPFTWFISRGAEMCDVSEGVSSKPNTCTLHKLVYPTTIGGKFRLETVKRFTHEDYHSNSWLVKITSNGRYILAPTIYGQIFVFNIASGQVSAIIKEHQDIEVRDVIFHPYRPLIFSCGDDGYVKVYSYFEA
ncbi:WD40-repeat-containing domain protein [Gilbertella persicaria]|uniref:WD40-repeat-containing domain protein n=1 Tax=Gilbertella persicaria TaxID=101096 RepID=UPI00221E87C7|nr:WD40-repeat-containing domain protein [Gilbertella persicaria]KAI8075901.1 WD40-repeat-containing domain protein [Gilbertella persicaria]